MTTYKTTPETVWVSPASYSELLVSLDPFTVHSPVWQTPETRKPARPCAHFVLASYGCENCFASHEDIAREERADMYQDTLEWIELESLRR